MQVIANAGGRTLVVVPLTRPAVEKRPANPSPASVLSSSFSAETASSEVEGPSGVSFRKASSGKRSRTLAPNTSEMA